MNILNLTVQIFNGYDFVCFVLGSDLQLSESESDSDD